MKYVLDTNAFLWLVTKACELPPEVRRTMETAPERLGVPAAVPIELANKARIGRREPQRKGALVFPVPFREWIATALDPEKYELLPISAAVAAEAFDLPGDFHKDPYDCLIVATARLANLKLVTSDENMRDYPHVDTLHFTPRR